MSWGSLSVQLIGVIVILPLVLRSLPVEEVSLWLLFSSITIVINLADFGFRPTLIRMIAYSHAGDSQVLHGKLIGQPSGGYSLTDVVCAMRCIYNRLFYITLAISSIVGTAFIISPVAHLSNPLVGWGAWAIVSITGSVALRGGMYSAFLHGSNNVALCQRWELICTVPAILASVGVLIAGGGVLELVLASQLGTLLKVFASRKLAFNISPTSLWCSTARVNHEVMRSTWSAAWRSGIGIFITSATLQGTGIAYAQFAPAEKAASYLLALKMLQILSNFSNVPFYSQIPYFSKLYAQDKIELLISRSIHAMFKSNWIYFLGIVGVAVFGDDILIFWESNISLLSNDYFLLMSIAFLLERIGAKHLQMYSLSNHILWHVVNGVTGIIMFFGMIFIYCWVGFVGILLGMLIAYLIFYLPYSMWLNYRFFDLEFIKVDFYSSFIPLSMLSIFCLYAWR